MKWMQRLRGLGAIGVVMGVVVACSLIVYAAPTWSVVAGHMSVAREIPTAVVLNDGRVVVIGGIYFNVESGMGGVSTAVDVYDPVTNSWTAPATSLHTGRYLFAATLLQDGRVLVTGGITVDITVDGPVARLLASTASANPSTTHGVPGSLAAVTLSAAGSSDPENDPLTFTWTDAGSTLATTVDPARTSTAGLAVGVHHISLSVDDGFGGISTATVDVTVLDATAPLHAQIAALASQLAASQQAIADAVSTIQTNLRASFSDPSFTIPGGTPQARLQAVIQAVVSLSHGSRLHLYKELGGGKQN